MLTANNDSAADLAQSTCLRAIEKASHYQAGTNLKAWLFTLAHRIWLNELRARAVRQGEGLLPVEEIDIPDPGPSAESNIFLREVLLKVYTLPEAQRAAVLLVYVEGFTYSETSEILDVPIGTIMSRLAAARQKLSSLSAAGLEGLS